jgi:hypothetical protein
MSIYFPTNLGTIAYNVPAVTDVFLRPIRKNAKHFLRAQKNVAEQKRTKGRSPDCVFA